MTTDDSAAALGPHLFDGAAPVAQLDLFARFVGTWRVRWRGLRPGEEDARAVGELAFGVVLGGRAVQDVWIVPGRGEPGAGLPPRAFHGTTIRMFDPAIRAWRSTWIDPLNARVRRFLGREDAGGIRLLSTDDDPWLCWRFDDVTPDRFRWSGSFSEDGGTTWQPDDEMIATRLPAAHGEGPGTPR